MQKKKGISLIVLVITIIVMIILSASVVISLNNTGVIDKANQAVDLTNEKQVQDLAVLTWADAYMDNLRGTALETKVKEELNKQGVKETDWNIKVTDTGITVTDKTRTGWRIERAYDENNLITKAVVTDGTVSYEIGTTVNYMSEGVGPTSYKGGWKLLGVDDEGRLLLMSSDSITGSTLQLSGQDGYINGLTTIANTVAEYKDGTIGVDVRSIRVEDIDAVTGYNSDTFTGEEYIDMAINSGISEEVALETFGFNSINEVTILNNNSNITFSWDGTEYPKYSYVVEGDTKIGNLTKSHSSNGFTYYDSTTNTFKIIPYTTGAQEIIRIKNDFHTYMGNMKFSSQCKAYQMFFTLDGESLSDYWLANRYTFTCNAKIAYGMRNVGNCYLGGYDLVSADGSSNTPPYNAVRAVVTLVSGIKLKDSTTTVGTYDIVQ